MLVYVRDSEIDEIMKEIPVEEIPPHLKERFNEENSVNEKLERDQALLDECGTVYIISQETVKGWSEGGAFQVPDDIYPWEKFYSNDEQRLMLKINKRSKVIDLLTLIRRKIKYPAKDLLLFRVKFNRKYMCYEFNRIQQDSFN